MFHICHPTWRRLLPLASVCITMLHTTYAHAAFKDCATSFESQNERVAKKFNLARATCVPRGASDHGDTVPYQAAQLNLYQAPVAQTPFIGERPTPPAATPEVRVPAVPASPWISPGQPIPKSALRAIALAPDVDSAAQRHNIDPLLLHAIAYVESRHDAQAASKAGAQGVMQVMPATASRFGVSNPGALRDARTNIEVSASYLKTLQQRFGNSLPLVLAAYNAGEGAVEKYGRRVPPYPETQHYVRDVLARYETLKAAARQTAANTQG